MHRNAAIAIALLVTGTLGFLVVRAGRLNKPAAKAVASATETPKAAPKLEAPAPAPAPSQVEAGSALAALFKGGEVPPLPERAPKHVTFGVVLFTYAGAEGAPLNAPSKEAAFARAQTVLPQASSSFEEAAKKGDPGSVSNAGRIPRGILEPTLEYVLFTLDRGKVFPEPVDTPRGYWILKRID